MIVYIYNIGVDLYNGFNGLRHRINWTYFTVLDGLAHPLYSPIRTIPRINNKALITKVSVEIDRLVILAKTIAKPVTLPVMTSLGIKKKYMATLMMNMASVIVKKLFIVFVFICKTSTFYYAKKSVKKEEN